MGNAPRRETSASVSELPFAPGQSPFRMKGMVWLGVMAFVEERIRGGTDAVFAELEPAFTDFLGQMFLATSWYDVFPILALAEAAAKVLNVDRLEYVKRSATWHAEQDMAGVYKPLLNSTSPAAVCRRFANVHQQVFDFGKARVVRDEPCRIESLASGMPEPLAWWWKRVSECYYSPVLRGAGAKNARFVWQPHEPDGVLQGVPLVRIPSFLVWS
jgi:hypothetical protein